MPVRIYDIAKKLGLESKEVLAKAKELGIASARVASSSLDKITAEYLESHFTPLKPAAPTPPPPQPARESIVVVTTPPEAAPQLGPEIKTESLSAETRIERPEPVPPPIPVEARAPAESLKESITAPPEAPPAEPELPPQPAGPRVGDLVGRIVLPPKPGPKAPPPPPPPPPQRTPQRPMVTGRPEQRGRFDPRPPGLNRAPGGPTLVRPGQPARPGFTPGVKAPGPAAPAEPKIVLPDTAQLISLKPPIIVRELAEKLNRKPHQLIADLVGMNVWATVNQAIDESVAQKVCAKYGFKFEVEKRRRDLAIVHAPPKEVELDVEDKVEDLKPRPPVVTIMGHVDHGKTTLLDVIRKSDVAAGEAGGITQHIGAYTISVPHPERKSELAQVTFLDTPGHAAFSAMRARGANVTDIVVLVVAANDGVMPQTIEALNHAKAAKVPIIVAVNKMDHPAANSLKVRQQLQEKGLVPDDWGGDTIFVDVSAIAKQNIDKLLEMILLQADLLELKANPNRIAKGNVIESGLSAGGPTATVLVRKGVLHVGDVIICGQHWGRVRALIDEEGKRLKEAGPSVAAKCLGLNGVPEPGSEFIVGDEKLVRELADTRVLDARALAGESRTKVTLENLFATLAASKEKVLKIVCKADTQGSVEAIVDALKKIESDKVSLEIIHNAVGTITESDVHLGSASNAIIIGFHTRIDVGVADVAKREGVQIKLYSIIYELIDEIKEAMAGLLDPILKENVIGAAEVKRVFELSKGGKVAGCIVSNGRLVRGKVRVMRRKNLIYEGALQTLRRFQDDVNEVRAGMECGIRVEGFNDYQVGDSIESYVVEKFASKL